MDTIQNFVKAKLGNQIDKFFIAGASKASGLRYNVDIFNLWEHTQNSIAIN